MKKLYKNKNARKIHRMKTFLLKKYNTGQAFGITWIKKNGEETQGNIKKKNFKTKGGKNTVKHISEYITLYDRNRKRPCNIHVLKIIEVRANGKIYTF